MWFKNVIFTNNDSAYETAISLNRKGISVKIIDIRKRSDSDLIKETEKLGLKSIGIQQLQTLLVTGKLIL